MLSGHALGQSRLPIKIEPLNGPVLGSLGYSVSATITFMAWYVANGITLSGTSDTPEVTMQDPPGLERQAVPPKPRPSGTTAGDRH